MAVFCYHAICIAFSVQDKILLNAIGTGAVIRIYRMFSMLRTKSISSSRGGGEPCLF